jgi:hypothetical protein
MMKRRWNAGSSRGVFGSGHLPYRLVILILLIGLSLSVLGVSAAVDPATVDVTLQPGETHEVTKTVDVPEVPPKLDLVLVVDNSGSYFDDLPVIQALAPGLFDDVTAAVADAQFGLATFVDFPFFPWGSAASGDYAYQLDQDLTSDKTTWLTAVNNMVIRDGVDEPESQLEALYQIATGAGRTIPGSGGLGEIAAGQNPSFRADATKVVALTTDAPMHEPATAGNCTSPSPPCPMGYPGPSFADTVAALNAAGIKVIALKAPGSTTQMDDLAAATGGAVKETSDTSAEIADAILAALEELTFEITAQPVGCDPLEITFDPASHSDVEGGTSVMFDESITVPADISGDDLVDGAIACTVEFYADDTLIGTQNITVRVVIEVDIDIKPGSDPNAINPKSRGVIPVAILSSADFDATTEVDRSSLTFGRTGDEDSLVRCSPGGEDVNGDGLPDLVCHFSTQAAGFQSGDTEGILKGMTVNGVPIVGSDSVKIVP